MHTEAAKVEQAMSTNLNKAEELPFGRVALSPLLSKLYVVNGLKW